MSTRRAKPAGLAGGRDDATIALTEWPDEHHVAQVERAADVRARPRRSPSIVA
jgi:hypothetical protein